MRKEKLGKSEKRKKGKKEKRVVGMFFCVFVFERAE